MVVKIITYVIQHDTYFQYYKKSFIIIFDRSISALGHGREVVENLNATDKRFIVHLIDTVKLPGSEQFYTEISLHIATHNSYIILSQEFQKQLYNTSHKYGI